MKRLVIQSKWERYFNDMSKLVECPNCIGAGVELIKGKYPKQCRTCAGLGMVNEDVEHDYLENHLYDSLD